LVDDEFEDFGEHALALYGRRSNSGSSGSGQVGPTPWVPVSHLRHHAPRRVRPPEMETRRHLTYAECGTNQSPERLAYGAAVPAVPTTSIIPSAYKSTNIELEPGITIIRPPTGFASTSANVNKGADFSYPPSRGPDRSYPATLLAMGHP